ncbi:MAG: T9SS type A sorting domain-containing protein, partial [Chitinophagaceae bacterium]
VQVSIYSMKGELLFKKQLQPGAQQLNLQNLMKGMYIMKAGTSTQKILL